MAFKQILFYFVINCLWKHTHINSVHKTERCGILTNYKIGLTFKH